MRIDTEKQIYACHLELEDYLSRYDGAPFDRESYRASPQEYFSEFDTKVRLLVLPRFNILVVSKSQLTRCA